MHAPTLPTSTASTPRKTKVSILISVLLVASLLSIAVIAGGPPTLTNQALASGELVDGPNSDYYYYYNTAYCPDLFCVLVPVILNMLETE